MAKYEHTQLHNNRRTWCDVTGDAELWLNMLPRAKGWEHWSRGLRVLQVQMFFSLTSAHVPRILTLNLILYSTLQMEILLRSPVHHKWRWLSCGGVTPCSMEEGYQRFGGTIYLSIKQAVFAHNFLDDTFLLLFYNRSHYMFRLYFESAIIRWW
jgi:hypothetical protein